MNNIKKVILSMDKEGTSNVYENLKEIIVVREDSIERYGKSYDIKKQYIIIAKELLEQYKDELKGLTSQNAIDKLWKDLKVIEYNYSSLIKEINIYQDENKKTEEFVVVYNDHDEVEKLADSYDEDDFVRKLSEKVEELSKTYNLSEIDEMRKLGLINVKDNKKELSETLKENKIKNFIVNHKTLSKVLAGAIVVTGIWGGYKLFSKNNSKDDNNNKQAIELTSITPTPTLYIDSSFIPTAQPTLSSEIVFEEPKEIVLKHENKNFPDYEYPENDQIIVKKFNGKSYYLGDTKHNLSFDNLFEKIRNKNMSSIGNLVQSNIEISDKGAYIYFENKFNDNLREKAYVQFFSMIGNQIVKKAYLDNNMDDIYGVKYYVRQSGMSVVDLIRDNNPVIAYINGEKEAIYFDELGKEAKEVVLQIAIANNCPTYNSIININGQDFTQDDISNIILDKWNELQYFKNK